jgi:hypothetical protein
MTRRKSLKLSKGTAVLVDRATKQVLVVKVLSEIPNGARRLDHLVNTFRAANIRVLDAAIREEASDE